MLFKIAKVFSSGTEYEIFKDNYCENECKFHKVREADGFPEFTDYGGCPIEDRCESARFNEEAFPNVLLEVWEEGKCLNWHHCPFYTKEVDDNDADGKAR